MGKAAKRKEQMRSRQGSREQRLWERRGAQRSADAMVAKLTLLDRSTSMWAEVLAAEAEYRGYVGDGKHSMASVERGINLIAEEGCEWAGIPMPLDGESLIIEPKYPFAKALSGKIGGTPSVHVCRDSDISETTFLRNSFWSWHYRATVDIWSDNGKIIWGVHKGTGRRSGFDLGTLGCADAWSLDTEFRAMATLRELVNHRKWRQYFLTGTFIETSKRSGVTYMFRRLKPTVAIGRKGEELRVLCCLCLHPIAYYAESRAGAMCPTDDVIAHLMLMRGDEALYWKRSNQHPAYTVEAAL